MLKRLRRAGRAGFTLVELLISMTLLTLVGAAVVSVIISQQRFYRGTNELMVTRSQLRQVAVMLPSDLRGISSAGNDVYFMSDSAIEFRSSFGSSVVCTIIGGSNPAIVLPPRNTAKGIRWTSWSRTPVLSDSIAIYDSGPTSGPNDDLWTVHRITGWTNVTGNTSSTCPSSAGLVQSTDLTSSNPSFRMNLSPVQAATVTQGAAVRFFRRVRYNLYRAADGLWYLGYQDCLPSRTPACSVVQPIGGPYQAYAAPNTGTSGVEFSYFDSLGVATTDRKAVARIDVVLRGESTEQVKVTVASGWTTFRDSLRLEIAMRNRK